ncbi:hypothetical protein ADL05_17470 [Nocardiopsis sp. NRRL B-16309]|nr:hypothetical protein ADL05_17470 [Nocardiopsis sp. NRRL B-16309]
MQRRSGTVWMTVVSREVTTSAHAHDLGRTALAAHLMGVDHDSDLARSGELAQPLGRRAATFGFDPPPLCPPLVPRRSD